MSSVRRPEHAAPPEIFYNDNEAEKYATNTRMIEIQSKMAQRALDLINVAPNSYILDIGCGSGLSGEVLTQSNHVWVGTDISPSMLSVAVSRDVEGDVMCSDMGQGLPFKTGTFDGAISISALQWLCNADKKSHIPQRRLKIFFESLYRCLVRGARAVFQVYPETPEQMTLITRAAMKAGFSGGLVVDYPGSTRAKKLFLVLFAGGTTHALPQPLDGSETTMNIDDDNDDDNNNEPTLAGVTNAVQFTESKSNFNHRNRKKRAGVKSREWIIKKKERRMRQGKNTARFSKYAGRKRKDRF